MLAVFTSDRPELGVGELARLLEMDKRRTQRLVSTLFGLGYLDQDPETSRYRPGVAVLTLGYAALESLDLRQTAQPILAELLEQFGQSVNLAVRDREHVVFVECLRGQRYRLGINVHIGDRLPVHLSSLGKAILSKLPASECAHMVETHQFERATAYSIDSSVALNEQLARACDRSFASMDQETALGVRSVAAPIVARDGYPVAAVNVAIPTPLMSLSDMEKHIGPAVVDAACRISALLTTGSKSHGKDSVPKKNIR